MDCSKLEVNKLQAEQLIKGKRKGFTTYGHGVQKAIRLLDHPNPAEEFNPKTGAKTFNFYYNILEPDNPEFVTVDRHAYILATGKSYNSLHPALYNRIARHYKVHSHRVGVLPNQLQAALWVNHTESNVPF